VSIQTEHDLSREDVRQSIAERAYLISEKQGFAPGRDLDHWLEAEAEVLNQFAATSTSVATGHPGGEPATQATATRAAAKPAATRTSTKSASAKPAAAKPAAAKPVAPKAPAAKPANDKPASPRSRTTKKSS